MDDEHQTQSAFKIVFYSDTHLGFDYPIRPRITRRRRGDDFFRNHETVLQYAIDNNANLVLHGGDLFFRSKLPLKIVDMVYDSILNFTNHNIPIVIVPGNHERSRLPDSLLIQNPLVNIFRNPSTYYFEKNGTRLAISGFPNDRDNIKQNYLNIVELIKKKHQTSDFRILMMHQAVEGSTVGSDNFTFTNGDDVVQRKDLESFFDVYLVGHIHRQQILYIKRDARQIPIIFAGSIERTSFAEKDEIKGFYWLEIDQQHILSAKWIPLPARPMVDIVLRNNYLNQNELETHLKMSIKSCYEDSIIRIKCDNSNLLQWLTSSSLNSIIPATMNYQLSGKAFQYYERNSD
jgi:DNA repair protein SbcD/Mre11